MAKIDVEQKIKDTLRRKQQAEELIKKLRARQKADDDKARQARAWVIGEEVQKAMESSSDLNRQIMALLATALTDNRKRALFGLEPKGKKYDDKS